MRKFKTRAMSLLLVAGMLFGSVSFPEDVKADVTDRGNVEVEERNHGYRDAFGWDINASLEEVPKSELSALKGTLPTSYSSADTNISVEMEKDYVTSIKNQGNYGTCWAHSAISLAETSYIMNERANPDSVDFNEYHLVHYTYNTPNDLLGITGKDTFGLISTEEDASLKLGGNLYFAMQVLANWIGVSDSSTFDAESVGGVHGDDLAYEDAVHLEDAYIIAMPDMSGNYQNDMSAIKSAIMECGSLGINYYSDSSWLEDSGYYYYPFEASGNHAVTVVGWDDTITSDHFIRTDINGGVHEPEGNGAWLIKNSWGTEYSDMEGYFWLSYYDMSIGSEAFAFDVAVEENYDNNYHHDGSAFTYSEYYFSNSGSMASAFVADSNETLKAVGFYTQNTNVDYEIRIYTDLEDRERPQDGTLALRNKGSETYIGFHTVELTEAVPLKQGERYAVVVTLSKPDDYVMATFSESYEHDWFKASVKAKAGESYWGYSVEELEDMNASNTSYASGLDVCIKAYTNEITVVPETGITLNHTTASLESGKSLQLKATVAPTTATYKGVTYTSSDTSLATVDANGLVMANATGKSGTVTITATSEYAKKTATCTITILPISSVIPNDSVINNTTGWVLYNNIWYYLINGQVQTGWLLDNGTWYYLDQSGAMQTGWIKDGGVWYYLKSSGAMATGWVNDRGTWYYMNGSGAMQTGWIKDGGIWYYLKGSGAMVTGWVNDRGTWYYMNSSGAMQTGWIKDGGIWYYLKGSGAMATGWVYTGGEWYYLKSSGAMATGWVYTGGKWYYLNGSGAMVTGKQKISGKTYYFNSSGAWIE